MAAPDSLTIFEPDPDPAEEVHLDAEAAASPTKVLMNEAVWSNTAHASIDTIGRRLSRKPRLRVTVRQSECSALSQRPPGARTDSRLEIRLAFI